MKLRNEDGNAWLDKLDYLVALEAVQEGVFGEDLRQLQEQRAADGNFTQTLLENFAKRRGTSLDIVRVKHVNHSVQTAVNFHEDINDDFLQPYQSQVLLARSNHLVQWRNCRAKFQQIFKLTFGQMLRQWLAIKPVENRKQSVFC